MRSVRSIVPWLLLAIVGAFALGRVALSRGESINAAWLLTAAICTYLVAYRFYARFIATKIFVLDADRATPAVRKADGHDYVPTNKWVVFGHHFAAIAGPARWWARRWRRSSATCPAHSGS